MVRVDMKIRRDTIDQHFSPFVLNSMPNQYFKARRTNP